MLITSFRPEDLVDTTGWWTVFAHPFQDAAWTLENYRTALSAEGFGNAFLNSLAVTIPATVIPITIAAFAAYAFCWMEFRGRYVLFVVVVGLLVVPLADVADPDPASLRRRAPSWGRSSSSRTSI